MFSRESFLTVKTNRDKFIQMSVEEKRKLYRCKENYVTIDKIQIWPEFYNDYKSNKKSYWQKNILT